MEVPVEGRPVNAPGSNTLLGVDGNAFAVMGTVVKALRRAGAEQSFIAAYQAEATSGDYDHLLAASAAYLDADQAEQIEEF
jgi:hypothetical protein